TPSGELRIWGRRVRGRAPPPAGRAAPRPPAAAHTKETPAEDARPSPAARRVADSAKGDHEASAPKSAIPKESGPGAAPSGAVGGSSTAGPSAATGPGGAPSVAQAAVSPAAEQAESPGKSGAPAPEASLEKDGGGCAPPEPAAEKEEGGGSCGGGGGEAPEEKQEEPPDVSGQDPKAAIGTVSKLAPDQAAAAMPGVDAAADKKVGEEQQRLDANPPKRERPSGAPQTQSGPPEAAAPAAEVTGKVEKLGPEDQAEKQKAKGSEKAEGAKPTDNTPPPPPPVADKLTEEEAKNVDAAADAVPTVDPELQNKTVGPAPKIRLEGESDPKRTDDQAKALKEKQSDIQSTGREDAAKPMGEDQIFPNAPQEQLVGKAVGRAGGKGGNLAASSMPKPGVGAVAKQERGSEIQGAAGQAQGDLVAKEKEQQQGEQQAKQEKQTEIDREVTQNAEKQTAERGRAAEDAQREREGWRNEQDKEIEDADKESEKEHTSKNKEIVKARDDKDKEVGDRKDKDNQQIDTERENAEKEAEKKKEEEKPSGGFFGWVADKVKSAFNAILEAVTAVFDAARKAVNGIIDTFKEWANKAIDFVRDLAIKAIGVLADALIAIGDVLLAAFPELRDKFRKAIEGLRDKAIAAVNALADGLKKAVNALLDALAAGLNALLDVLEAGIKAVIKIYQAVILGAIKFAQAAIEALGKFAALIADIAPDPFGWLGKAGSSAKAGISDHLWGAIKTGVKRWFDTKVEGILGLGKAVINVLVKGCVSIKQIGKMAWDAIIASLPMMIASLVIEKVVSMLVPAAGAILTIVQGLMAAWQSLSSILTAFSKFWAYLKAVKAGPAACLFAEAVAAGIVALLDFIANFLLIRIESATKGVGKRLKVMAEKIMKGLKKTGKGAKQAAGDAVNRARGAVRSATEALRKPTGPSKPKGPRVPKNRSTSTDRGPGRGTQAANQDRPTSKTPDKERERRREESEDRLHKDKESTKALQERGPDSTAAKDRAPNEKPDLTKDKTPDTPKKKRETEAPKRTKPREPKSPLGKALQKIKGKVKSALKKVRNAGKALGKKLRRSKLGQALMNSAKKVRDFFKKKRDRMREDKKNRTDGRKQRRDSRKKKEKSQQAKHDRLDKILPRLHRILKGRLEPGIPQLAHRVLLAALRTWYRLTSLTKEDSPEFRVRATLNPGRTVIAGISENLRDYLKRQQLPRPVVLPLPRNGTPPGVRPGSETNAKYINPVYADEHGREPSGQTTEGFDYLELHKFNKNPPPQWDRMHLIPREVGGAAKTTNFVPARNEDNKAFYNSIEKYAGQTFGSKSSANPPVPGWYKASLTRYSGTARKYPTGKYPEGFPKRLEAQWGLYARNGRGSGLNHTDWRQLPARMTAAIDFAPPPVPGTTPATVNINKDSRESVKAALRQTAVFMDAVMEERAKAGPGGQAFNDILDMRTKLAGFKSRAGKSLYNLDKSMEHVEARYIAGLFTF
ncbi:hypothetical protein HRW17_07140, partial [Streptomyces lunaelactis]|nr:hypothetical protein [Streptomyces lunaelactis]